MLTTILIIFASIPAAHLGIGAGQTGPLPTLQDGPVTAIITQGNAARETALQTLLWTNIDRVLDKIPEGTIVDRSQFENTLGTDKAALLLQVGLLSITSVSKPEMPDHFVLAFASKGQAHTSSGDLIHERVVEFDTREANGQFEMAHIKGVTARGIITVNVDDAKIAHLSNGNTSLTGHAHKLIPLGSRTFIFDPDGKQVLSDDNKDK
jgi:hypothetical protein